MIKIKDQHDYGYEVPPRSRKDLIMDAHAVHKTIGYTGNGPFPIVHFAEQVLYYIFDDYSFEVLPEADMGDAFGLARPDEHLIQIREDIYNSAIEGNGFSRMVITHETVHLLEHEGIPREMARRLASRELPAYNVLNGKQMLWQEQSLCLHLRLFQ